MSVETVMARIAELHQGLVPPSTAAPASTDATAFRSALQGAPTSGTTAAAATTTAALPTGVAQTAGQRALQFAQAEIGQAEQPPGSNDSPRIAEYRTATAGSGIGPWCAYFVSWAAKN